MDAPAGAPSFRSGDHSPLVRQTLPSSKVSLVPGGPLEPLAANPATFPWVAPLRPPGDLWERIRRGYRMPDLDNGLVHERERWYAERPDYILRMAERSRKYLFHIVEELELRDMPTELALLPFVESGFNPQAVSSAKAAGMWQFMPATGKHFELTQNAFRDDRRDVLASTDAALDYLQKLHGMFGDWHLALAAYNWGEGNVSRAIDKNQRANLGTGYQDLDMPAETRLYVPKLQALKNIVAAPQDFVASFPVIGNHPYFDTVTITHDIDVALAAKLAEVQLDDFKALNASANRPVILAAGTPQILLPWDNALVFKANLRAYAGAQLASWTAWRAPFTMRPADAAKRVGMGEPQLRAVNHIPAGVVIRAGSTLLVPRLATVREDVAERVADNGQLSLSPLARATHKGTRVGKNKPAATRRMAARNIARNKVAMSLKPKRQAAAHTPVRSQLAASGPVKSRARVARRSNGKPIEVAEK